MSGSARKLGTQYGLSLIKKMPSAVKSVYFANNELVVVAAETKVNKVLYFLQNHSMSRYKSLIDLTAVDYPEKFKRFELVYMLLSVDFNTRIRVKTFIPELFQPKSVSHFFKAANWMEREVMDMFGINFLYHNDLRRILTDYGFEGHPFRKDFPLNGFTATRYDDTTKMILQEPTELSQEYRNFDYQTPWRNISTSSHNYRPPSTNPPARSFSTVPEKQVEFVDDELE